MSGLAYFLLVLVVLVILLPLAYIFYTRLRAQRAGHQPPPLSAFNPFASDRPNQLQNPFSSSSSSSSGILSTIKSKLHSVTGTGSAQRSGAYEQPLHSGRGRGLDPDGAWDARVGNEADAYGPGGSYEEQELGTMRSGGGGGYRSHGTELPDYGDEEMGRGRSISRDEGPGFIGGSQGGLDQRYDEEMRREGNPFGDQAERSELRGVSPRPDGKQKHKHGGSIQDDSPTERRSMFHENM
ncbi:MAG: hypothetical protein Q9220_007728 [cf. Caloplaca sp. 1 TL-2023]